MFFQQCESGILFIKGNFDLPSVKLHSTGFDNKTKMQIYFDRMYVSVKNKIKS